MKRSIFKCGGGLLVALAAFALVLAATSCSKKDDAGAASSSSSTGASSGVKELTVWCWDPSFNIYAMNVAAEIYGRDHPDVKVNIVETPWGDLQQKLITSLTANDTKSLPDIILCQDNAIQKNIVNYPKAFYPLEGKVDLSEFAQFKVAFGEYEGKHYSVPFDNGATGTFIRTDIIADAGLTPEDFDDITWSEYIRLGKIVKEKTGKAIVSYSMQDLDCVFLMLQSAGRWVFDEAGNPDMANNPVLKEAMTIYSQMVHEGICITVPDWNAYVSSINNGTVASAINGCWIVATIKAQPNQKGKWAVVSTPRLDNAPGATNYSSQGGSSWMVMASSKNVDLACDFLSKTFAGSKELYETMLPVSGAVATWAPAGDTPAYGVEEEFFGGQQIFKDILSYTMNIPHVKYGVYNYEARDAFQTVASDILTGKQTVDEAIAAAEKQVRFLMGL